MASNTLNDTEQEMKEHQPPAESVQPPNRGDGLARTRPFLSRLASGRKAIALLPRWCRELAKRIIPYHDYLQEIRRLKDRNLEAEIVSSYPGNVNCTSASFGNRADTTRHTSVLVEPWEYPTVLWISPDRTGLLKSSNLAVMHLLCGHLGISQYPSGCLMIA